MNKLNSKYITLVQYSTGIISMLKINEKKGNKKEKFTFSSSESICGSIFFLNGDVIVI